MTYQSCFSKFQSTLLPYVSGYCKGLPIRPLICGRNTTKQKTHCGVPQKAKASTCRSGIDCKLTKLTESPNLPMIGQMLGWNTWTILEKSTSPRQRRIHEGKDTNIHFTYNEDRASATSTTKICVPRCKESIGLRCKSNHDKKLRIPLTSKRERQRLRYLEWLSTNWAEYFAEERPQPSSSSSSWSPSSTWWSSSSQTPKLADVAVTQLARR